MPDKPQRLRELIVRLGHEPLAEIPDVAEAIETEALEILDALVEQLDDLEGRRLAARSSAAGWKSRYDELVEQLEAWDETFREILDVTERWTRPLTDEERLLRIDTLAKAALARGSNPASSRVGAGTEGGVEAAYGGGAASLASPARSETADESSPASIQDDLLCRCGGKEEGDHHFDRSICACGAMHYYCNRCGYQCEPCDSNQERTPDASNPSAGSPAKERP